MALKKYKQIAQDPILAKAPKAEHGFATFAHLNDLGTEVTSPESLKAVIAKLPVFASSVEALAANLQAGDLYVVESTGVLAVVIV